jgi:hypothetical protein
VRDLGERMVIAAREGVGGLRAYPCLWLPSWLVIIIQFKYFHAVLYHNYFVDLLISVVNWQGLLNFGRVVIKAWITAEVHNSTSQEPLIWFMAQIIWVLGGLHY